MSFIDGIKNFFIPEEEDGRDTVPNDTPAEEPAAEAAPRTAPSSYGRPSGSMPSASSFDESRGKGDRYTTIKTTAQFQVVLVKASVYTSDSKKVVDYLMQNKTVVLNLEGAKEPDLRRIIDFVVGAAYAMHGRIRPIANQTFLIIPQNVGFDGDSIVGELQDSGLV